MGGGIGVEVKRLCVIDIGRRIEVRPAWNPETGERDIHDEITWLAGEVIAHGRPGTGDHLVRFRDGDENWVYVTRLKQIDCDD